MSRFKLPIRSESDARKRYRLKYSPESNLNHLTDADAPKATQAVARIGDTPESLSRVGFAKDLTKDHARDTGLKRVLRIYDVELPEPPAKQPPLASVRIGFACPAYIEPADRQAFWAGLVKGRLMAPDFWPIPCSAYPIPIRVYQLVPRRQAGLALSGEIFACDDLDDGIKIDPASYLDLEPVFLSGRSKKSLRAISCLAELEDGANSLAVDCIEDHKLMIREALENVKNGLSAALSNQPLQAKLSIQRVAISKRFPVGEPSYLLGELIGEWLPGVGDSDSHPENFCDDDGNDVRHSLVWTDYRSGVIRAIFAEDGDTVSVEVSITGTANIQAFLGTCALPLQAEGDFDPVAVASAVHAVSARLRDELFILAARFSL